MDTTVMKDSIVGDAWIKAACEANPVQQVLDPATGLPNGNWLTGPVRLVFCDSLFEAKPQMRSDPNSAKKHSTGALFTPYTNMQPFWDEYYRVCASDFAEFWNPHLNPPQYAGIDNPIADQGYKAGKYSGYTPGLWSTTMSSNYKPPIVDPRMNPIVDEKKVYAGVWAIIAFNTYASGKKFPRKGPRFGLQSIVIIGDDKVLSGGAPDAKAQFGAIKVSAPVAVSPAAFGQPPAGGPGAPGMAPPAAAYYPAGGIPASNHMPAPRPPGAAPGAPPSGVPDDEDLSQFG